MEQDMGEHVDRIFTEHGRVICSTCRYFREGAMAECAHPNARLTVRTWKGEEVQYVSPAVRNADNNCRDFRAESPVDKIVKDPIILLGAFVWASLVLGITCLLTR